MTRTTILLFASSFLIFQDHSFGQMVSGPVEGELYINCDWYMDDYGWMYYGLFHSTNNGQTLSLNYEYTNPPQGNYHLGLIESDASQGVLYNLPFFESQFLISHDHGNSWTPVDNGVGGGNFTSGCVPGEIYHFGFSQGIIERSENFATSFDSVRSGIYLSLETGNTPGVVFGKKYYPFTILVSYDSCLTFPDTTILDTAITGDLHPELYRGANPGELYLVSFFWFPENHFKIFFSDDYGSSWYYRYTSDPFSFSMVGTAFTGGWEDGSFYVMMGENDPTLTYTVLTIMYSNDTAKTFTSYVHDLTATYGIPGVSEKENPIGLEVFPNPAYCHLTIKLHVRDSENSNNYNIKIRDNSGKIVEIIEVLPHQGEVTINLSHLNPGVYIGTLCESEKIIATDKFIIGSQ